MELSKDHLKVFNLACRSDCHVLITGATGTGKTSLAKLIHQQSERRAHPFMPVNLASLAEGVLESELFGHERGAFTGADQKRIGKLELAQGGTVFLDEIGELTPRLQARLLEFLQNRTITPVGSNKVTVLNVRVIAATHKDLLQSVRRREFREDLFHRLRVISIGLKSLVERQDELPSLISSCIRTICEERKKPIPQISSEVMKLLESYSWPGNVRELKNALEYAVFSQVGEEMTEGDLPAWLIQSVSAGSLNAPEDAPELAILGVAEIPLTLDYEKSVARFEKEYLIRALRRNGGRINRTARQIGLNKTTLLRRIKLYSLSCFETVNFF